MAALFISEGDPLRRFLIVWISLLALLSAGLTGNKVKAMQAADFAWLIDCQESEGAYVHYWVGYTSSADLPDSYLAYIGNGPGIYSGSYGAGEHHRVIDVLLPEADSSVWLVLYPQNISITISRETSAPACDSLPDQWQPGAPSIYIPMESDCAFIEIRDPYDHWHRVDSDGEPVLLHYGQALIGGQNQSTDPADYRAVATACF